MPITKGVCNEKCDSRPPIKLVVGSSHHQHPRKYMDEDSSYPWGHRVSLR